MHCGCQAMLVKVTAFSNTGCGTLVKRKQQLHSGIRITDNGKDPKFVYICITDCQ